ncbi:hypothetical protein TNCV_1556341 [Trichonephila clavipes]|nr:hypothetical protein TNCV_1556341 [Trichonephila clavipes]
MELVPKNDYAKREAYYLPHHAVLRDSSTTKLRVVFDASAKSKHQDDLLSGTATEKEAVELVWQLKEMMRKGGFYLRKWQSNSETLIKKVAKNNDLKKVQNDEEIKILGIQWNPKSDFFSFSVSLLEERCI